MTQAAIPNVQAHIPALDSLRFFAATAIVIGHYTSLILRSQNITGPEIDTITNYASYGMMLFFTLSGFVIHYNYSASIGEPDGIRKFWVARFARLYPLFILCLALEMANLAFVPGQNNSSCGRAGSIWGMLLSLPYYLTFTQSWMFSIICNNNIVFQGGNVMAVSWSISVEFFLYIAYCIFIHRLINRHSFLRLAAVAAISAIGVALWFHAVNLNLEAISHIAKMAFGPIASGENGSQQDSLMRWLRYFIPLIWLMPFISGAILAEIVMRHQPRIEAFFRSLLQNILCITALLAAVGSLWFILNRGGHYPVMGLYSEFWLVPGLGALIFCCACFPKAWLSRALSTRPLTALGEASYSIYMLHAVLYPKWPLAFKMMSPWALYGVSIATLLILSRITYLYFERPVQRAIRKALRYR